MRDQHTKRQTTHPRRQRRRERALERKAYRDGLTAREQLARLNKMGHKARRERARLERQLF